jgi:hypothetical protein
MQQILTFLTLFGQFAISLDRGSRILRKQGGGYWCGCDARPHGVGVGFTSPVHKIEGNFCNKALTSAGTESGIFCKEGGWSNRDWFSLELKLEKLDDFTTGFRTTCADMAGGWEKSSQ